jgi:ketosteroid isomerase-like protein
MGNMTNDMEANKKLITSFYQAFRNKDFAGMQTCYDDRAVFNDEVFQDLNATEVRAMWEMLVRKGKDLQIEFKNIKARQNTGSAEWVATYTFSKTGRKVINRIKADFVIEHGKILSHTDHFNFSRWARQAAGITGLLLGWTSFFKKRVQRSARESLMTFMARQDSEYLQT